MSGAKRVRVTPTQHTKCSVRFCRLVSEQSADLCRSDWVCSLQERAHARLCAGSERRQDVQIHWQCSRPPFGHRGDPKCLMSSSPHASHIHFPIFLSFLCHIMLHYVTSCYIMLLYVTLCYKCHAEVHQITGRHCLYSGTATSVSSVNSELTVSVLLSVYHTNTA